MTTGLNSIRNHDKNGGGVGDIQTQLLDWAARSEWCLPMDKPDFDKLELLSDPIQVKVYDLGQVKLTPLYKGKGDFDLELGIISNRIASKLSVSKYRYFFQWRDEWWLLHSQTVIDFDYVGFGSLGYSFWRGWNVPGKDWQGLEFELNLNVILD